MSDIGLIMDTLLGLLLVGALAVGWRLERRLKALKASHQSFSRAVEDLDRAAGRAEQGLSDLRAATDEAAETLATRIERAGYLAGRLEKLTAEAEGAEARLAAAPRPERRPPEGRDAVFARFAQRYGARPAAGPVSALAEAAARNDLILEDELEPTPAPSTEAALRAAPRIAPEAMARIERLRALARPRPQSGLRAAGPRANDDDLFEAPARRAAGGLG
ncbi:MAG: DUF6468 domain-containing protein [Caulobacteraceae bacterium]